MGTTIEWVEQVPARTVRRRARFVEEMEQLKSRPGVWANVVSYPNRFTATNAATTFRNKGFQTAVRKVSDNLYRVFARYIP